MKLIAIAVAATFALLAPVAAEAATCQIIIYYSDASLTRPVGSWSNCPGQKGLQGKRTPHREVMTEEIVGPRPGPGGLPCDFLVKGCKAFSKRAG